MRGELHNRDLGERGQGMAEYALLIAAIAAVILTALTPLGAVVLNLMSSVTSSF